MKFNKKNVELFDFHRNRIILFLSNTCLNFERQQE